jgi:hypothetical protein
MPGAACLTRAYGNGFCHGELTLSCPQRRSRTITAHAWRKSTSHHTICPYPEREFQKASSDSGARRKMVELMLESYPRMPHLFPRRHCWLREGRIRECAQRYANNVRPYVEIPKQYRTTIGAEMEPHLSPFRGFPNILPARPFGLDLGFLEGRCDPERRARAALTLTTVTSDDAHRLTDGISSQ